MPNADALCVCSERTLVSLEPGEVAVVGERVNPTGKRRMKEALRAGDADYLIGEAVAAGMCAAAELGVQMGLTPEGVPGRIAALCERFALPTSIPCSAEDYCSAIGLDKAELLERISQI